ncbi:MAG: hypothetical protein RRY04_06655 [Oscillospiraceae bacterium]
MKERLFNAFSWGFAISLILTLVKWFIKGESFNCLLWLGLCLVITGIKFLIDTLFSKIRK